MSEEKTAYEGNATRSKMSGRYDLIPPAAIQALARRLELGAGRHGDRNWESGGEEFRKASVNHLMKHFLEYLAGRDTQENLDAMICNVAFLIHFEEKIGAYRGSEDGAGQENRTPISRVETGGTTNIPAQQNGPAGRS
jgi:hypothetical protein